MTEVLSFGGSGDFGALGHGPATDTVEVKPIAKLAKRCVVDIACGAYSSAAVTDIGEVYVHGEL